jgi:hypothetical protein
MLGIPACVGAMEIFLMHKFGRTFNEDQNEFVGGITILEACNKCFSNENDDDNTATTTVIDVDDEYADRDLMK